MKFRARHELVFILVDGFGRAVLEGIRGCVIMYVEFFPLRWDLFFSRGIHDVG
jgi:hypothetical protein